MLTAEVGSGEVKAFTQEVNEMGARRDIGLYGIAVYGETEGYGLRRHEVAPSC
jgi:hypothetical protein